MNYSRGSQWFKWDLHVHTPASLVHLYGADSARAWERFIAELEDLPKEFKVLGINDYIFIEGYRRLIDEKARGRLKNIDLLLPVIELRLDKFGGTKSGLSKVNFHVIFSDEINPDVIQTQFINALCPSYSLSPGYAANVKWSGVLTRDSLKDLGDKIIETVPKERRSEFGPPLIEGFNNLTIPEAQIFKALQKDYFKDKFLTAAGKTEWADIKWNDHSIADKKSIINRVDMVFISSDTPENFEKSKKSLKESDVNSRLVDCSDAHQFKDSKEKDRIGKCFTWIKADTTFLGLKHTLTEYEQRVFVGEQPKKISRVSSNRTKYVSSLELRKVAKSPLDEIWFNGKLDLNCDLIAIIGNKGNGKSALADILGLMGHSKRAGHFSFLNGEKFRRQKNNKSQHFEGTIRWEDGTHETVQLDSPVDTKKVERIKYIPQNLLEVICNEIASGNDSDFDKELKEVIFSHVGLNDRLEKESLDELLKFKTSETYESISFLKSDISEINLSISILEGKLTKEHSQKLENAIAQKGAELEAHNKSRPVDVPKPDTDPAKQKELEEILRKLQQLKADCESIQSQVSGFLEAQKGSSISLSLCEKVVARFDNIERQFTQHKIQLEVDLKTLGIDPELVLKFTLSKTPILDRLDLLQREKSVIDMELDVANPAGAAGKLAKARQDIFELQAQCDEPNKRYQEYLVALDQWNSVRAGMVGDEKTPNTLKYDECVFKGLAAIPDQLSVSRAERLAKVGEIYRKKRELSEAYRGLYEPVQTFISSHPLSTDKFNLNFEVAIVENGFQDGLFEMLNRGVSGTFCGIEDSEKRVKKLLDEYDLDSEKGAVEFVSRIMDCLLYDQREGLQKPAKDRGPEQNVIEQLKKGRVLRDLYDLVFSLDYLNPRYTLKMGEKELSQLSPGEKGTLLLIFYLLVDKRDIPLVIDQPEENLDNQTVFDVLVPCIKSAKVNRQIVIVTHNPNLAVVCDAEQVIYASIDKKNLNAVTYVSGAIENTVINKHIIDVLEGTRPAFDNRSGKYFNGVKVPK